MTWLCAASLQFCILPFLYEQVTMEAKAAGETFAASGKVVKSQGWKEVYEGGDQEEERRRLEEEQI